MWWILYVFLACICLLLFRILRELHVFAFITAFNLALGREVAFAKVLTDVEKKHYKDALETVKQKYPTFFQSFDE